MITEWIVGVGAGLVQWIATLLPDWVMPADLAAPGGFISNVFGMASGFGPWVDWGFVTAVLMIPPGVWVVGIVWRALRMAFSHLPFFGGNG